MNISQLQITINDKVTKIEYMLFLWSATYQMTIHTLQKLNLYEHQKPGY